MSAVPPKNPRGVEGFLLPKPLACAKAASLELDKACAPGDTVSVVAERLRAMADKGLSILEEVRRTDVARLNIPVYTSLAGEEARRLMPGRKQAGKGASKEQAEASALMALVERYSFYAYWERLPHVPGALRGSWTEAQAQAQGSAPLISPEAMLRSVGDAISPAQIQTARQLFDLMPWTFVPALQLGENRAVRVPVEWFRMINEHNGCAAGNTVTESILQGVCELAERHVCAVMARGRAACPWGRTDDVQHPVLRALLDAFAKENIQVLLKDFSLDMPLATVAVLAVDPSSFPAQSEIVFTAGTATSPVKAAIHALTEAAQLGGDFCTKSCYESLALPKYGNQHEARWLEDGPAVALTELPDTSAPDMLDELLACAAALTRRNVPLYSLDLTHPDLGIPVHYTLAPGLDFLQRDTQDGIGLFIGRRLAEEAPLDMARRGLDMLGRLVPDSPYLQFFRGILSLRSGDARSAGEQFAVAGSLQKNPEREALASYYGAYSHVLREDWSGALPWLDRAIAVAPAMSEPWSLRGICRFRLNDYPAAAENFKAALRRNKGSAPDLANLGASFMEMGDHEQAGACLAAALSMDPGMIPAKQRLERLTGKGA